MLLVDFDVYADDEEKQQLDDQKNDSISPVFFPYSPTISISYLSSQLILHLYHLFPHLK